MRNRHARALHEGRAGEFRPKIQAQEPRRKVTRKEWEQEVENQEDAFQFPWNEIVLDWDGEPDEEEEDTDGV